MNTTNTAIDSALLELAAGKANILSLLKSFPKDSSLKQSSSSQVKGADISSGHTLGFSARNQHMYPTKTALTDSSINIPLHIHGGYPPLRMDLNEAIERLRTKQLLSTLVAQQNSSSSLEMMLPFSQKTQIRRKTGFLPMKVTQEYLSSPGTLFRSPTSHESMTSQEALMMASTSLPSSGACKETFPEKLHKLLMDAEKNGFDDIVGFFPHGRAFAVFNRERFVSEILPKYFNQKHISSFRRQLNLYCFTRITSEPGRGGYYHKLFLKERPDLCVHMKRVAVKSNIMSSRDKNSVPPAPPPSVSPSYVVPSPVNHQKSAPHKNFNMMNEIATTTEKTIVQQQHERVKESEEEVARAIVELRRKNITSLSCPLSLSSKEGCQDFVKNMLPPFKISLPTTEGRQINDTAVQRR